jgi:hypothetical protein
LGFHERKWRKVETLFNSILEEQGKLHKYLFSIMTSAKYVTFLPSEKKQQQYIVFSFFWYSFVRLSFYSAVYLVPLSLTKVAVTWFIKFCLKFKTHEPKNKVIGFDPRLKLEYFKQTSVPCKKTNKHISYTGFR